MTQSAAAHRQGSTRQRLPYCRPCSHNWPTRRSCSQSELRPGVEHGATLFRVAARHMAQESVETVAMHSIGNRAEIRRQLARPCPVEWVKLSTRVQKPQGPQSGPSSAIAEGVAPTETGVRRCTSATIRVSAEACDQVDGSTAVAYITRYRSVALSEDALVNVLQRFDVGRVGEPLLPLGARYLVVHLPPSRRRTDPCSTCGRWGRRRNSTVGAWARSESAHTHMTRSGTVMQNSPMGSDFAARPAILSWRGPDSGPPSG